MTTYLDSSVLFDALEEVDCPEREAARRAIAAQQAVLTTTLAWDEVVWVTRRRHGKRAAARAGKRLLEWPGLALAPIDRTHARSAQHLVEDADLHPRDALHAATAVANGCSAILSIDSDFADLPIRWICP